VKELTLENGCNLSDFMKIKELDKAHYEALYIEQEGADKNTQPLC
jgi:hypothetical protein